MNSSLSHSQIRQLLLAPEPEFKNVGLQQLLLNLPETTRLALEFMARAEPKDAGIMLNHFRQRFAFLRNPFGTPRASGKSRYAYFDQTRQEMGSFIIDLREVMKVLDVARRRDFLRHVSQWLGFTPELQSLVQELWSQDDSRFFEDAVQAARQGMRRRQFMIFLSYQCNLQCPYCFAKDQEQTVLPLDKVLSVMDWALAGGAKQITFCGGEPTIYPHFPEVLKALAEKKLRTYFATNLLGPDKVIRALLPEIVDSLIVHVAPRETYQGGQWERLLKNLKQVRDQGVQAGLRINMFKPGCNFEHVFFASQATGFREFQLALTFPNPTRDNIFIPFSEFRKMIPDVLKLKQECETQGIKLIFSKPIPLCLFPEADRLAMLASPNYPPACSVFEDNCTYNACLSPSENVSPCLGLLDHTRPWSSSQNWDELAGFCRERIMPLLDAPLFEHCPDCFLFERRLCQGACLAHKNREGKFLSHG